MSPERERLGLLALLIATLAVCWPSLGAGPVDWDDGVWLGDPILALSGPEALIAAFTTARDQVYPPLLRLSFWALRAPLAIHAVTLAMFLGSIVGIHALLRRLGLGALPSMVAIAVWALHPTRVECAAWITGLKDVQSLALLVAMALLLIPAEGRPPRIALGTAAGIGALLTKAAVFPVPFALLALIGPRIGWREAARRLAGVCGAALALALVGALVWGRREPPELSGLWGPLWVHGAFWIRLIPSMPSAIVALPADPRPVALIGAGATLGSALLASRWPRVGWPLLGIWLLPQLPFLGLVPMAFWASDRHLLIPSLGPAVALALAADRMSRSPWLRAAPLLVALASIPLSARRVHEWRDSLALWEADATRPGEHWARWHKLGVAYGKVGRFAEAEAAFDRSLALRSDPETLAHRLIASLAADGWTRTDAVLARLLEPPPDTEQAWARAIAALRQAGEEDLAALAEDRVHR